MPTETSPLLRPIRSALASSEPSLRDVAVCVLTYFLSILFVVSPLRRIFGKSGSKHLVATTAVWFHPVRTRGSLIEVLIYTVRLLSLDLVLSGGGIGFVKLLHFFDIKQWIVSIALTLWLGASLGLIGVLKVRANNASFNTASSAAIIFLVSVLLREEDARYGSLPLGTVLNYLEMVSVGALISGVVSLTCYRRTSLQLLQQKTKELEGLHSQIVQIVIQQIGKSITPTLQDLKVKANITLASFKQQAKFVRYERMFAFGSSKHYDTVLNKVLCLERQAMHLGGIMHCLSVLKEEISLFTELKSAMAHLATSLIDYSSGSLDRAALSRALVEYVGVRDTIVAETPEPLESKDQQAQAACILLAHLLNDITEEIIEDWSKIVPNGQSPEPKQSATPESVFVVEQALYNKRVQHKGLGPKIWKFLRLLRNLDVRHGLRVGVGAMILSLPAYIPQTKEIFQDWRGEWAVITYMIIMARNLGAMTHNIPLRLIGTSIGASIGIGVMVICQEDIFALVSASLVMSSLCYRRILSKTNPVFGRFILLSYNLVCLNGFSLKMDSPDDDPSEVLESIYDIAFHRVISVTTGILWAVFITVSMWPHSARQALRSGLCIQWMRMGMSWKNDFLGIVNGQFRGMQSERELQEMMLELDLLLKNCPYEFRLRGKFNSEPYKQLLDSTQTILDAFHSFSILVKDDPEATESEKQAIQRTFKERRELCHSLFLQFYTASTSVRLGFPVPEYLPQPDLSLSKFAKCIRQIETARADNVLFFSYMTVVHTISAELRNVHESLRTLFGTLDDDILFAYV